MADRGSGRGFEGEALILLVRLSARPRFLAALHHLRSPVGPSVELVSGELALPWRGPRGLRQTTLATCGGAARAGEEPVSLRWWAQESQREVIWEEKELRIRAEVSSAGIPVVVPSRLLHPGWPGDEARPPERLPARLRRARAEIDVPRDDPLLGWLAGRCPAVLLSTTCGATHESWAHALLPRLPARAPAVPEPG